jgi:twitching motility protein PilU
MINYRNVKTSSHILTIEDPIEFLHTNKKSIINQREVGSDTKSYARALKSAMREAPDVILIGEIRDRETMQATIDLAGTGHLAIATLHSNNCPETLDRIINMFPEDQHSQVYMDLSQYLRAIISQRLVRGVNGDRSAAVEIMLNTPRIAELIQAADIAKVKESFYESTEQGMQTFDQALLKLYQDGKVTMDEALANADSRANLESSIHFG